MTFVLRHLSKVELVNSAHVHVFSQVVVERHTTMITSKRSAVPRGAGHPYASGGRDDRVSSFEPSVAFLRLPT